MQFLTLCVLSCVLSTYALGVITDGGINKVCSDRFPQLCKEQISDIPAFCTGVKNGKELCKNSCGLCEASLTNIQSKDDIEDTFAFGIEVESNQSDQGIEIDSLDVIPGQDCYAEGKERAYNGTTAVTEDGDPCTNWEGHTEGYSYADSEDEFVDGIFPSNFCRSPSSLDDPQPWRPWCYTADTGYDWGYCDIPECLTRPDLTFEAIPMEVVENITPSVSMTCRAGNNEQTTSSPTDVRHVLAMFIRRGNKDVASISTKDPARAMVDLGNLSAKGNLTGKGTLELSWTDPSDMTMGEFMCYAYAVDEKYQYVVLTSTLTMTSVAPTIMDLIDDYNSKIGRLEKWKLQQQQEIQQLQHENQHQNQTISNLQKEMEKRYWG